MVQHSAVMAELKAVLREAAEAIGIAQLKTEQKDAIMVFARGRDVFVSLPTGYGKSVCYGCLPGLFSRLRVLRGMTAADSAQEPIIIVITPLVSIMKDQTREFKRRGVSSIYITATVSDQDERAVLLGHFSLVYISPEQLLGCEKWREMLRSDIYQEMMVGFIVDEAHCVKKWYISSLLNLCTFIEYCYILHG